MDINFNMLFKSEKGERIFFKIAEFANKRGIIEKFKDGVVVGFSGGPDSVFLLAFLLESRSRFGYFDIELCHVNHMIRGAEADFDEDFSRKVAEENAISFHSLRINVPEIAKKSGKGIEEAARDERYAYFDKIIRQGKCKYVCVAHNATDNLETVIFNMMRGSGLSGICGIPYQRGNVLRPLLSVSKSDILELLDSHSVPYCIDSTNSSTEYTRNYIRHSLLPLFKNLAPSPEEMTTRMVDNLLCDKDYLDGVADDFISHVTPNAISREELARLHPAIFARVFSSLVKSFSGCTPERKHILKARELISFDNFSMNLPGKTVFFCERGVCSFKSDEEKTVDCGIFPFRLTNGINIVSGTNIVVYVGEQITKSFLNVYNFSITAYVSSDIIENGLYLRLKEDGDSYKYGGITRKLKKVFNDLKIPPSKRDRILVICDNCGILWVPGLPLRDNVSGENKLPVSVCFSGQSDVNTFYPVTRP